MLRITCVKASQRGQNGLGPKHASLIYATKYGHVAGAHHRQGCGIPMPDLSDFGFLLGREVQFSMLLVCGQVSIGTIKNH